MEDCRGGGAVAVAVVDVVDAVATVGGLTVDADDSDDDGAAAAATVVVVAFVVAVAVVAGLTTTTGTGTGAGAGFRDDGDEGWGAIVLLATVAAVAVVGVASVAPPPVVVVVCCLIFFGFSGLAMDPMRLPPSCAAASSASSRSLNTNFARGVTVTHRAVCAGASFTIGKYSSMNV